MRFTTQVIFSKVMFTECSVINKENKMKKGYWYFDEYEDDWVYVPSSEELAG